MTIYVTMAKPFHSKPVFFFFPAKPKQYYYDLMNRILSQGSPELTVKVFEKNYINSRTTENSFMENQIFKYTTFKMITVELLITNYRVFMPVGYTMYRLA